MSHNHKKPNRDFYRCIAADTEKIITEKKYQAGKEIVNIESSINSTRANSIIYPPDFDFSRMLPHLPQPKRNGKITVTNETTFHASRRLFETYNEDEIVVLNFASAKNPGGGFLNGANAQEESLCRQSTLFASIGDPCRFEMYQYNRNHSSLLYSDYMIFSPDVIIFRDDQEHYLENPVKTSVITCPAANLSYWKDTMDEPHRVMLQRCRKIIQAAIINGKTSIVLGAFGTGVFANSPADVANYFKTILIEEGYKDYFDIIVFAIIENKKNERINIFQNIFKDFISTD